jgi:VanZ family protein
MKPEISSNGTDRTWRVVETLLVASWSTCLAVILVLSLIPISVPGAVSDKVLHALAFLVASALTFMAFRRTRNILIGLAVVVLVGIVSEAGQLAVPGRYASFLDLLADFVGVVLGVPLGLLGAAAMNRIATRLLPAAQNSRESR